MKTDSGHPQFSFRSGHLALDFAATLMFREGPHGPRELLVEPSSLATWLVAAGVLDTPPAASEADLAQAVALRESIYRLAAAGIAGKPIPTDDRVFVNGIGSNPPPIPELAHFGHRRLQGDASSGLVFIARAAVTLLGGPEVVLVRQCGRAGCTRLFVDRSRGANRIWCGMRECGNRVHAAAYRRRRRHSRTN